MINTAFVDSSHPDFQMLAHELEQELYQRDGKLADVNQELNKIEWMKNAPLAPVCSKALRASVLAPLPRLHKPHTGASIPPSP